MTKPVIVAEGLGKVYTLDHQNKQVDSFREAILAAAQVPFRRLRKFSKPSVSQSEFWALRNVSFEVQAGEVVGVIGRNGSGKSTLLKILSRIVEPTKGKAKLRGRIASLLEVGTGFHAELSGRENIYLNGSIMGMKRREIDSKFDEIVAFSEVEKFLDTPVKRYSSGMYVRLAFAVAAHLEPEILIVDEVLAVGDSEFQKKCLGKMRQVSENSGRTVLFVSHNMSAVAQLCSRAILLEKGEKLHDGSTAEVLDRYLSRMENAANETDLSDRVDRHGRGAVKFSRIEFLDRGGGRMSSPITGRPMRIEFRFTEPVQRPSVVFTIYDSLGNPLTCLDSARVCTSDELSTMSPMQSLCCEIEELFLVAGRYRINAQLTVNGEIEDRNEGVAVFTVEPGSVRGRIATSNSAHGSFELPHRWVAT